MANGKDTLQLWQWIPLSEYRRPVPPVHHNIGRLWRRGTPAENSPSAPTLPPPQRGASGRHSLEEEIADSLARHLAAWLADPTSSPRLIVLAPHLGIEDVLRRVARLTRSPVLEPPSSAEILTHSEAWLDRLLAMGDGPVVVPALHRMFLQHADGLTRLRELLTSVHQRRGRTLVGCESWGWRYLRKALRLGAVFGEPLTLQAVDADGLADWLPDAGGLSVDVLRQLAVESGGNVAVAHALVTRIVESGAAPLQWRSRLPAWPPESSPMETFVAHSLLIHGGLPIDALAATILASDDEIRAGVEHLAAAGLIEEASGTWRVTAAGYPAVRTHLLGHDYVDDF